MTLFENKILQHNNKPFFFSFSRTRFLYCSVATSHVTFRNYEKLPVIIYLLGFSIFHNLEIFIFIFFRIIPSKTDLNLKGGVLVFAEEKRMEIEIVGFHSFPFTGLVN